MKIFVKMFPIPGICTESREMEFALCEGNLNELLVCLQEQVGAITLPLETLMFLHNGRGVDINENLQFRDEDRLWILPQISGG